jgi:hypothetical protein
LDIGAIGNLTNDEFPGGLILAVLICLASLRFPTVLNLQAANILMTSVKFTT